MNQNPQKDSSRIFLSAREIIGSPGPTGDEIGYLEIDWHDIAALSGLDEPQTMNLKTWIGLGYRDGTVPMIGTSGYGHYDKQHRVLCYGDSNTYGYDPRSCLGGRCPKSIRWTALLEADGWNIFNEGQNGRCIPQRDWEIAAVVQKIHQSKAEIVIAMLGSDDLLQHPGLGADACAKRMGQRSMRCPLPCYRSKAGSCFRWLPQS